jgi:hypothetical protein
MKFHLFVRNYLQKQKMGGILIILNISWFSFLVYFPGSFFIQNNRSLIERNKQLDKRVRALDEIQLPPSIE